MGRLTTLIGALVLVVAACGGSASPTATQAPVTPAPAATAAPATPTPAATRLAISAAVTFDGQKCSYAGPSAVPLMATVKFTLTNTPAAGVQGAALIVGPVVEGTTWEQVVEWANGPEPDFDRVFLGQVETHLLTPGEAESSPLTAVITRNLSYFVLCLTNPEMAEGGLVYPATLLNVLEG